MNTVKEWFELMYYPEGEQSLLIVPLPYTERGQVIQFKSMDDAIKAREATPSVHRDPSRAVTHYAVVKHRAEIMSATALKSIFNIFKNQNTYQQWYEIVYFPGDLGFDGPHENITVGGKPLSYRTFEKAFWGRKKLLDDNNITDLVERGHFQIVWFQMEIVDPIIRRFGIGETITK